MAIINRTPDSFFDRGATFGEAEALDAADRAVAEGAEILDIGGVKAAPGVDVDTAEEIRRVAGFVGSVRDRHPEVVISRRHLAGRGRARGRRRGRGSAERRVGWHGAGARGGRRRARPGPGLHARRTSAAADPAARVCYDDVVDEIATTMVPRGTSRRGRGAAGRDPHRPRARLRQEQPALAGGHPPAAGDRRPAGRCWWP